MKKSFKYAIATLACASALLAGDTQINQMLTVEIIKLKQAETSK